MRVAVVLLALGLFAGCGGGEDEAEPRPAAARQKAPATETRAPDSPALQFLPRLSEARGWTMQGDPQVIAGENVEDFLAGQARIPTTYGALDLTVGRYTSTAGRWATVVITRYPDFVKAFGAFSASVPDHAQPVAIGNRGAAMRNNLTFWSGPYVASISGGADPIAAAEGTGSTASIPAPSAAPSQAPPVDTGTSSAEEDPEYRESFGALAGSVAERMPRAESLPAVFRFFPRQRLIPGSEGFSAAPVFGQPALAGAFTAEYQSVEPNKILTAAIVPTPDKQTAARVLASYRTFFERNGRLLDPVPNLGEENFIGEDRLAGRSVAFRLDRFVVVINGYAEILEIRDLSIAAAQQILNEIRQQLEAVEEQEAEAANAPLSGPTANDRNRRPGQSP